MPTVNASTISRVNEAASRGVDFRPIQHKLSPIERRRLVTRRCKRKPTLFRKCNEYAQLCDSQIWLVLQANGSDRKEVFHSDPTSNFPFETWANIRDRGYPDPILHEPATMGPVEEKKDGADEEDLANMPCQPRFVLDNHTQGERTLPQPMSAQSTPNRHSPRERPSVTRNRSDDELMFVERTWTPAAPSKASGPVSDRSPYQVATNHEHAEQMAAEDPPTPTNPRYSPHDVAQPGFVPSHGSTAQTETAGGQSRLIGGAGQPKTLLSSRDGTERPEGGRFAGTVFQNVSGPAICFSPPPYASPPRSSSRPTSRQQVTHPRASGAGQSRTLLRERPQRGALSGRQLRFRGDALPGEARTARQMGRITPRRRGRN